MTQHQKLDPTTIHDTPAQVSDFLNLHEIVAKARQNLNQNDWDYIVGGAESETTLRRNRMALETLAFRPRILRDVSNVDASTMQFGRKMRLPLIFAPVGSLESFHRGGCGVGRARRRTVRGRTYAELGLRPGARRARRDRARCAAALSALRARRRRLGRMTTSSAPSSTAIRRSPSRSTPRTTAGANATSPSASSPPDAGGCRTASINPRSTGRPVERIKKKFKIPLAIKGIATGEDARIAVEHGVEWVYVSNHGGRQLDHGRGSVDVLPEVVDAVGGRAKVIVDGSICRGSDVVKAVAAGADLVAMGRMQCFALGAAGEAGVLRLLELLEDEVQRSMGLLGVSKLSDLNRSYLHPAPATQLPHVLSAFNLLKVEEYRY